MADFIPDREAMWAMSAQELASMIAIEQSASFNDVCTDIDHLRSHHIALEDIATILRYVYAKTDYDTHRVHITPISAIEPNASVTILTGTVLRAGRRRIVSNGQSQVVTEGSIGDQSARIAFISWADHRVQAGETIVVLYPSIMEWHGKPQLSLTEECMIIQRNSPMYTPFEVNSVVPLAAVSPGDRALSLEVHVIDHNAEAVSESSSNTPVASGILADATGRLPFTDWHGHANLTGAPDVTIQNVSIQQYKGFPTVNIAEFSHVSPSESTIDSRAIPHVQSLASVHDYGQVYDIILSGTIIELQDGTGLIERCPACNRVLRAGSCRTHGSVSPVDDLRIKAILDDGTAPVMVNCGTTISETFYGGTIDEAIEATREAMDMTIVEDQITHRLLGQSVIVRGRLRMTNIGPTLEAHELSSIDSDPQSHAKRVLKFRELNT